MDTDDGDKENPLSNNKFIYAKGNSVDHVDPSGKAVYKLKIKSTFFLFDHRVIVGDTGNNYSGSCYKIEFWGDDGIFFGSKYEPVKNAKWHYTLYQANAVDTIKQIIKDAGRGKIVQTIVTSVSVDQQLNQEAAQMDNQAGTYVLGYNDCGTGANEWLNKAWQEESRNAFVPPPTGGANYISSFSIDIGSISGFGL